VRLALAQINPVVGDLDGNRKLILERLEEAKANAADLVLFPELAVTGYPPEDLLLRPGFIRAAEKSVEAIAREARGTTVLVGGPHFDRDLYNACYVLSSGEVKAVYRKRFLPNYGVFDEDRYFAPGRDLILLEHGKTLVGLTVCEDMWQPGPPATDLALAGAELLVNVSASPFYVGRDREREEMFITRARDNTCFIAFCNTVGGQDELVFDGHSAVIDDEGTILARAPGFEEALLVVDVEPKEVIGRRLRDVRRRALAREREAIPPVDVIHVGTRGPSSNGHKATGTVVPFVDELEQMRLALELGLRDYVDKNGFERVLLGLSGGIDSALTACIAVDALGAERVAGAIMPSPHSSDETQHDAHRLAENLGIERFELPIEPAMGAYDEILDPLFAGTEQGIAEENIQARTRGNLLMALSNKFGWLVLTTGNKSELSVGYSTLYGDMAGGFGVLKDVPKTLVYRLARFRNGRSPGGEVIPASVIERAPSAELRPGQRDEDSLPPYDLLDAILEAYVEEDQGPEQLVRRGLPKDVVERVIELVDKAEYKRRQAPPGIKISPKAFGRDRRLPITNKFRG
jgi:NAD+ synthase (glutamine-hydrolysing)